MLDSLWVTSPDAADWNGAMDMRTLRPIIITVVVAVLLLLMAAPQLVGLGK